MTLLPWRQQFCDNQMYFMLDHTYVKFQSNLTCVRSEIDHLNFYNTGRSNHMTSQILLDAQDFCPANYADLAIFEPL